MLELWETYLEFSVGMIEWLVSDNEIEDGNVKGLTVNDDFIIKWTTLIGLHGDFQLADAIWEIFGFGWYIPFDLLFGW